MTYLTILLILILFSEASVKLMAGLSFASLNEIAIAQIIRGYRYLSLEQGASLSLKVLDSSSGFPVAWAKIYLQNLANRNMQVANYTSISGDVNFRCPAGEYQIKIEKKGYQQLTVPPRESLAKIDADYFGGPFWVTKNQKIRLTTLTTPDDEFVFNQRSRSVSLAEKISRLVFFLELAILVITSLSVLTDGISKQNWLLPVTLIPFWLIWIFRELRPSTSGWLVDLKEQTPLRYGLIRVYQKATNQPILAVSTNRQGKFSFKLPAGKYDVVASKLNYHPMKATHLSTLIGNSHTTIKIGMLPNHLSIDEKRSTKFINFKI